MILVYHNERMLCQHMDNNLNTVSFLCVKNIKVAGQMYPHLCFIEPYSMCCDVNKSSSCHTLGLTIYTIIYQVSKFILVSYWLKNDHVKVTKFNC